MFLFKLNPEETGYNTNILFASCTGIWFFTSLFLEI